MREKLKRRDVVGYTTPQWSHDRGERKFGNIVSCLHLLFILNVQVSLTLGQQTLDSDENGNLTYKHMHV